MRFPLAFKPVLMVSLMLPRRSTRTYYDALRQTTKVVQNYTVSAETANSDVATEYGHDGDGNLLFVKADEPGGAYQQTQYVYGVTTAGGSVINSNDVLSAVQHPDKTTGSPSSAQQDSQTVNALGQVLTATDRNGNVHTYTYDILGRKIADAVTTLGAGVDGSVRRIETAYDTQGNAYLITSPKTSESPATLRESRGPNLEIHRHLRKMARA